MPQIIFTPDYVPAQGKRITAVGHGFTTGQQVFLGSSGNWGLAMADDIATLKTGMVAEVFDADNFVLVVSGIMRWAGHGLTVGKTYYLSDTVPGGVTDTKPTTSGLYEQACFTVEAADTVIALSTGSKLIEAEVKDLTGGYRQNIPSIAVGDWLQIARVNRFFSGDLFISTNQSGNSPQLKLTILHVYSLSKCYLAVQSGANGGLPFDEVVITGGPDGGGQAEVWIHWNQVSAPSFDIAFTYSGTSATDVSSGEPVVWDTPLPIAASPGTIRKSVAIDKSARTFFPELIVPPSVSPFTTGYLDVPAPVAGQNYGLVRFDGMPMPGSGSIILNGTADDTGRTNGAGGALCYGFTAVLSGWNNQNVGGGNYRLVAAQLSQSGAAGQWMFDSIQTSWDNGAMSFYIRPFVNLRGFRLNFNIQCSMNAVIITERQRGNANVGTYGSLNLKTNAGVAGQVTGNGSGPII